MHSETRIKQMMITVFVSGAPLSAPPSIDNCGGSEDRVVDYRRNDVLGRGTVTIIDSLRIL